MNQLRVEVFTRSLKVLPAVAWASPRDAALHQRQNVLLGTPYALNCCVVFRALYAVL